MSTVAEAIASDTPLLKLNLGAGKSRMEGYLSVDSIPFEGLDLVANLNDPWPWADESVSHIHMSHVLEHFTGKERVHIMNEAHRVLVEKGQMQIITPHWCSNRAYGDFTHCWPPVSEMYMYYLWKQWRKANAPHTDIEFNPEGYKCDFDFACGYGMHPEIRAHNSERQQFEMKWYKDACEDLHSNLTAYKSR